MNLAFDKIKLRILQMMIILIPVLLFCFLIVKDIAPGGMLITEMTVGEHNAFIDNVLPSERVSGYAKDEKGRVYVSLLEQPVYFSLHEPNTHFDEVKVDLIYKNDRQSTLQLGALMDIYSDAYDLKTIQSQIVEDLNWDHFDCDFGNVYTRLNDYNTCNNFESNPPLPSDISLIDADYSVQYREYDYENLGYRRIINVSLRGYHKYMTYIKNEPFYLRLDYMDMNRLIGADDIAVRIWNENGELWYEHEAQEDGNTTNNQISSMRTIEIDQSGWPEGVYSVELSGTSDIFWRTIQTSQRYVTFIDRIYIGDSVGYMAEPEATEFYTDAKYITAQTYHADSTQRFTLGDEEVFIPQSHEKETVEVDMPGVVRGYTPAGDIKIEGAGGFAFSSDAFFAPYTKSITTAESVDILGVDYIIVGMDEVQEDGDLLVSGATFNVEDIFNADGNAKMTISAPRLQENQANVDIYAIRLTFTKDTMSWKEFLIALRDLLPFGL